MNKMDWKRWQDGLHLAEHDDKVLEEIKRLGGTDHDMSDLSKGSTGLGQVKFKLDQAMKEINKLGKSKLAGSQYYKKKFASIEKTINQAHLDTIKLIDDIARTMD